MIEYQLVDSGWLNNIDDTLVESKLNELGKDKWRLLQILPNSRAVFYRELDDDKQLKATSSKNTKKEKS